jgi:hypothetical protein
MKKVVIGACLLFSLLVVNAQDKTVQELKTEASKSITKDPNDTIPKVWKKGGIFNLVFNQGALSNWSAGGDNSSLSLSSLIHAYAFYKKGKHSWDNTVDLAYGFVSTTSLGTRKSDDRIDILSKYGYEVAKSWYISGLFNARSQFAPGYNYPSGGGRVLTSNFAAPAYVLVSPGINYMPNNKFSFFLSPITARWVIVTNDSLSMVKAFGVDSGKHVRTEIGAFASITYTANISPNAVYNTRLDLFSNYLRSPQDVDIYWTNILAVKVTKLVSMTLSVDLVYDNDIKTVKSDGSQGGATVQLKELLGIGLSYKF